MNICSETYVYWDISYPKFSIRKNRLVNKMESNLSESKGTKYKLWGTNVPQLGI